MRTFIAILIILALVAANMFVYFRYKNNRLTISLIVMSSVLAIALLVCTVNKSSFSVHNDQTTNFLRNRATDIKQGDGVAIYIIDDFLSPTECHNLRESAGELIPSPITRPIDDPHFRDSETMFFNQTTGPQQRLEQKICAFMGIPEKFGERSQIQHYRLGNQFKAHHDYFNADDPGEYDEFIGNQGQRTWTFMIYLNDVEGGGATEFVKIGKEVRPKQGRAVIWHNLHPDGTPNVMTMHRGTPVKAGEKYIITKWFRENKVR